MGLQKRADGLLDLENLDPAVASALDSGFRRTSERALPKVERKSRLREKRKAEARKGKRVGYDMPPEIIRRIADLAERNETTASQVAALGLHLFLEAIDRGEIDISDYKRIANANPRYAYRIDLERP